MSTIDATYDIGIILTDGASDPADGVFQNPLTVTTTGTVASGDAVGVYGGAPAPDGGWQVSNSGLIQSTGDDGIQFQAVGTVTNTGGPDAGQGTISGAAFGVNLAAGGSVTNSGSIEAIGEAGTGVYVGGAADGTGAVANQAGGAISGGAAGVQLASGGTVTNAGLIEGTDATGSGFSQFGGDGVLASGVAATVNNVGGTISGYGTGVYLTAGGTVSNTGLIETTGGSGYAVNVLGAAGTVTNTGGTIAGALRGVDFEAGGTVDNSGTITGANQGVLIKGAPGTVTGSGLIASPDGIGVEFDDVGTAAVAAGGTIAGGAGGVYLAAGGSVTNAGLIEGTAATGSGRSQFGGNGVLASGVAATVNNAGGTIAGYGNGVYLTAGGTVSNAGLIETTGGSGYAVNVLGAAGSVTNTGGTIAGAIRGVDFEAGGTVDNSGTISGANQGVLIKGAPGTVTDSGTISGGTAVEFDGAYADRLILQSGAVLDGAVVGQTGEGATNTLELAQGTAAAAGTLANFQAFSNFGTVAVDAGASWLFAASNVIGPGVTLTDAGTLSNAGSVASTVTLLAGAGAFTNAATGLITVAGGSGVYAGPGVDAASVSNAGTITGQQYGVALYGGGAVTNTGSIGAAGGDGVHIGPDAFRGGPPGGEGPLAKVLSRAATAADGTAPDSITNAAGAVMTGGDYRYSAAASLGEGGTVSNAGLIQGGQADHALGVLIDGGAGSVTNSGTIDSPGYYYYNGDGYTTVRRNGTAVQFGQGGTVSNAAGGTITGGSFGVDIAGGSGTVANAGSISGAGSYYSSSEFGSRYRAYGTGVHLGQGGTVTNAAGAVISGASFGIDVAGGSGTVADVGTITGIDGPAIRFASGNSYGGDGAVTFDNRLILDPDAVLNGTVQGGYYDATNTLELAPGTAGASGTVTNFNREFESFGTIAVDAGASWALAGSDGTIDALIGVAGTLFNAESSDLTLSGPIVGTGTLVQDDAGSALTLSNSNGGFSGTVDLDLGALNVSTLDAAGTGSIVFGAGPATLNVAQAALSMSGGTTATFGNTIGDFNTDDLIDLAGIGTTTASFDYATDRLTLTGATGTTTLQFAGDYTGDIFAATPDGANGTDVTLSGAARPVITGTHATSTAAEAPVTPFSRVTVDDANPNSAETLVIALSGAGGTLRDGAGYAGLASNPDGSYTLTGSAASVTGELDALVFTPAAGAAGTPSTTTFQLTDTTRYGTRTSDAGTTVTDTAAATTPTNPGGPTNPGQPTNPAGSGAVSIDDQVFYDRGVFTIAGTASSGAGVSSVEISAVVDGVATDLGAATVAADGSFSFSDRVGAHTQGFITATETDRAGGTASGVADYALTGGLTGPFKARQDRYNADGSATVATDGFKADGSQKADLSAGGQVFAASFFDTFQNQGNPDTTFVFDPGHGLDIVKLFRVDNVDHDTLSFKGSDFGNDVAQVLANTYDTPGGGALIVDPTSHDAVKLTGVTKTQLAANQQDFTFHA